MTGGPYVGTGLEDLLKATWLLASLIHGRKLEAANSPKVIFSPGIADRGAWGCCVELRYEDGSISSAIHGTIDSCLLEVNSRFDDILGGGYRY